MGSKVLNDTNYAGYRETVEYVKTHGDIMTPGMTEAQKKDYKRLVDSNPQNVFGAPAFFPPLKISSTFSFDTPHTQMMIEKGYWAKCEKCQRLYNVNYYGGHECEPLI